MYMNVNLYFGLKNCFGIYRNQKFGYFSYKEKFIIFRFMPNLFGFGPFGLQYNFTVRFEVINRVIIYFKLFKNIVINLCKTQVIT